MAQKLNRRSSNFRPRCKITYNQLFLTPIVFYFHIKVWQKNIWNLLIKNHCSLKGEPAFSGVKGEIGVLGMTGLRGLDGFPGSQGTSLLLIIKN